MAKLGDVCISITDGSHNPPVGVEQSPFIMLSSKNIEDNYISLSSPRYLSESDYASENKRTQISAGDLLVTIVGTIGRVAIVPPALEGICVQRSVAVLKTNPDIIDNRFLMYQLQNMRPRLEREAKGVAQKGIYLKQLSSLTVSTPPLEEQKRIAAVLDKVTDLIAQRRTQLDKLDLLVKSRFMEMFGDPVSNPLGWKKEFLKDICIKLTDGTHFSPDSFETGEYKYITAKNIKTSGFDFTNITYISEEVHRPIYERCNPELGDVLYIKDGVTTGIAMVNTLDEEFSLLSSVALLKQDRQKTNGYFLAALLNNENMYTDIRRNMGGAAITRLTIAKLNIIPVILPPIELQNQFSAFVEKIEKSKLTILESLDKLEIMKKALMQQYFV